MIKISFFYFLFSLGFFALHASAANAATLYVSPASGAYGVGQTFTAAVYVNSAEQAMNAASGVVSFPADKLNVISLTKDGSVMSLWVEEPSFSNAAGIVNFEGIVLNPGFQGSSGKVLNIIFRNTAAGTAPVTFSSGAVLANDGRGTNILSSLGSASYTITLSSSLAQPTPVSPVALDAAAPSTRLHVTLLEREDSTDPIGRFRFEVANAAADIDFYEVRLDGKGLREWRDDGTGVYETPALDPGFYTLFVRAVDKEGNSVVNSAEFEILPLRSPRIVAYPPRIESGYPLELTGETDYPNARAIVWLQSDQMAEARSYELSTDKSGVFRLVVSESLEKGVWSIWAVAQDARGAKSLPSAKVQALVESSPFVKFGTRAVTFLAVLIPLVALVALLALLFLWSRYGIMQIKKRLRKETREAESALEKAFASLRQEMRTEVQKLEVAQTKRTLTKEEDRLIARLKRSMEKAEKEVGKEIKDIEKELK